MWENLDFSHQLMGHGLTIRWSGQQKPLPLNFFVIPPGDRITFSIVHCEVEGPKGIPKMSLAFGIELRVGI